MSQKYKTAILCVDDENVVLQSLKMQLNRFFGNKYLLEFAHKGQDALDLLDELVDEGVIVLVIISDWLMPGMKGDEFLSIVNQSFPDAAKVMLTGHASEQAIKNAREKAKLFAYIKKPWNANELLSIIEKALATVS
ncbi:MAG: response regulator [Phycisphaerae bacterium]|nr:response regulator [Phycisphaerae bacterium]